MCVRILHFDCVRIKYFSEEIHHEVRSNIYVITLPQLRQKNLNLGTDFKCGFIQPSHIIHQICWKAYKELEGKISVFKEIEQISLRFPIAFAGCLCKKIFIPSICDKNRQTIYHCKAYIMEKRTEHFFLMYFLSIE